MVHSCDHLGRRVLVSIQLVSPASGERNLLANPHVHALIGFHSISFPSEWGVRGSDRRPKTFVLFRVSIQLVSPASGEADKQLMDLRKEMAGFPFN